MSGSVSHTAEVDLVEYHYVALVQILRKPRVATSLSRNRINWKKQLAPGGGEPDLHDMFG